VVRQRYSTIRAAADDK